MSKLNFFDRLRRSHLKDTKINVGSDSIYINPKVKLILAWSLFALVCIVFVVVVKTKVNDKNDKKDDKASTQTEEPAYAAYEKDAYPEINTLITSYYTAVAACDGATLKTLVTNPEEFDDITKLQSKAEYIKGYNNLVCFTKPGYDSNSMIVFAQTNVALKDVVSEPYDIYQFYVTKDKNGNYLINNGELSTKTQEYMTKVASDEDIMKVYADAEANNNAFKESDATLVQFYELISNSAAATTAAATEATTEATTAAVTEATTAAATEATVATEATTAPTTAAPDQDQ